MIELRVQAPYGPHSVFIILSSARIGLEGLRVINDKNDKNDKTVGRPEWTHKACKTTQIHTRRGANMIKS